MARSSLQPEADQPPRKGGGPPPKLFALALVVVIAGSAVAIWRIRGAQPPRPTEAEALEAAEAEMEKNADPFADMPVEEPPKRDAK